jgi:hypothetical protein
MKRLLATAVAALALVSLTSCSSTNVDPSVGHGVQAAVYASMTAGWQRLTADAEQACHAQVMGGDVTKPAADFGVAAKAYTASWASAAKQNITGPRLPHGVTVPASGADWCQFSDSLASGR